MELKILSSLEKCFPDEALDSKAGLDGLAMLQNERFSFQVGYQLEEIVDSKQILFFSVESPLAGAIRVYRVRCIPSMLPAYRKRQDELYLRTQPGLFPDLLEPITDRYRLPASNTLNTLWLEVDPQGNFPAGRYPITCVFSDSQNRIAEITCVLDILPASLPEQKLIFTQWFYTDCLLQYYGTEAFDEAHWQIIENFMGNAVRYGQNMILTPVLTPALDTYVGGERPTTQLVEVFLEKGQYRFDFSRLGRWVDLCDKMGIRYLEINHFFTQWGAAACPKVMAWVDGTYQRIFGWDTPSHGDDYREFLYALIPAMLRYLREEKNGAGKRCYFHLSDEPRAEHLEQYTKVSQMIRPLLEGYPTLDALSEYDFYAAGATTCPIPPVNRIEPFLEHRVPNLWTYYCCSQCVDVSNRFFAMPSWRTRIIGVQLYKFGIAGFLHWGYNFYNSQYSHATIDPFLCSDAECAYPSGDAYSVYPGKNGQPWPSLRQAVFYDALQDLRLLQLCESLHGRAFTMQLLEEGIAPITFKQYPTDPQWLPNLRKKLHQVI